MTNKSQDPISNDQNIYQRIKCSQFKYTGGFVILNLGHCNLFVIYDLSFGILLIYFSIVTALTTVDQQVKVLNQISALSDKHHYDRIARLCLR